MTFRQANDGRDRADALVDDGCREFAGDDGTSSWPSMLHLSKAGPYAWASSAENWLFEQVIEHMARCERNYPGKIIDSVTVSDGGGLEHQRFLHDGDEVALEIGGIGVLRNQVRRA